jgi:glycosyltransferase involved in cell wall biosynthesis
VREAIRRPAVPPPNRARPRVALFTNNYLPRVSGVAVAVDFLERALSAAGHATLVVAPDYGPAAEDALGRRGAANLRRVRSLPLRRVGAAIPLPRFDRPLRTVAAFRPDVLHAHHPFLLGESAIAAADALGVPLVYTFHTLYESFLPHVGLDLPPVARAVRAFVRRFVERCDLVVAPTEPVRRHLVSALGVSVPTATAPTGLDPERFERRSRGAAAQVRAALGLGRRTPLLVWAGRITAEKNPRLALRTLEALVERGYDAGLVFLGEGPAVDELTRESAALGFAPRVAFAGFVGQERLPEHLAAGDVFLFTSACDTQGIVAYEAWAAGLPIVAVRSMAGRAVVEPGRNGLLSDADPRSFADAVERLRERPELAEQPFPWEVFGPPALAEAWGRIYAEAMSLGRRSVAGLRPGTTGPLQDQLRRPSVSFIEGE